MAHDKTSLQALFRAAATMLLVLSSSCGGDEKKTGAEDSPPASEPVEALCSDGTDDDGDGTVDCDDLDCRIAGGTCVLAPPLDRTVVTTVGEAARFLYDGADPLQKGVDASVFDPRRIAIVRGKVVDRDGAPLAAVRVSVLNHTGYGYTRTRPDGLFDLAVNGGASLVFVYEKDGFLSVHRTAAPGWQRYGRTADVGLVEESEVTTALEAEADAPQTAQGDPIEDAAGKRQPLVILGPGTTATAVAPDGSETPLSRLTVRLSEYPFEQPAADRPVPTARFAPGPLPVAGSVHYGLELAVDEAEAAGARTVVFSNPVAVYVDNFLELPVGMPVPFGHYDRTEAQWQGAPAGRVVRIVGIEDGKAELDADGDGVAEESAALDALGVTDAELVELGKVRSAGATLWRSNVTHFSPWEWLFPVLPPPGALPPGVPAAAQPLDVPSRRGNAVVEPRAVAQSIGISGTPYALHYQTDRTLAYGPGMQISLPLLPGLVPPGLKKIYCLVDIGGQLFENYLDPEENLTHVVVWDGKDGFGRSMQGPQNAHVFVAFFYGGSLASGSGFAIPQVVGIPGVDATIDLGTPRPEIRAPDAVLTADFEVPVGVWDAKGYDLGGFGIDVLHAYDPVAQTVFYGWGDRRTGQNVARVVKQPAKDADLGTPDGIAVASDGSVVVTDDQQFDQTAGGRILRVGRAGQVTVVAGPGAPGEAASLDLGSPQGIAVRSDGTVVVADYFTNAVREIHPDGSVTTLVSDFGSDHPVVEATLPDLDGVALGPREELYIVDGDRVFRYEAGVLDVFAGGGSGDDGVAARDAALLHASGIAVAPDGSVFVSERGVDEASGGHRVRKITPDGTIRTVAGNGAPGFSGDGGPATSAELDGPRGLALGPDGTLYIADQGNNRIRQVTPDGVIQTILGDGDATLESGQLASKVKVDAPDGIAAGPDGKLYVAGERSLYEVSRGLAELSDTDTTVPSQDGRTLYRFDHRGRHQATLDAMTGVTALSFTYDDLGRLASIVDVNGLSTRVERDPGSEPSGIVAPFGQRTALTIEAGGVTKVEDDLGREVVLEYTNGILTQVTDPKGGKQEFGYDPLGGLLTASDPTGYTETFMPGVKLGGYSVTVSTPGGRSTVYSAEAGVNDAIERAIRLPDQSGLHWSDTGAERTETAPNGTMTRTFFMPDISFGAQSLLPAEVTATTPGGRSLTTYPFLGKQLTDIDNGLSVEAWTELLEVNGRVHEKTYERSTRVLTTTSPTGRKTMTTLDEKGRPTDFAVAGLASVHRDYDAHGHVVKITRTAANEQREETFGYGTDGLLESHTDAMKNVTTIRRDVAGRVEKMTLPDTSAIEWGLDEASNVVALTPPGRSPHLFAHRDGTSLLDTVTPPTLPGAPGPTGLAAGQLRYDYTADHEVASVARSDGTNITFAYDPNTGRPSSMALARGTLTFGYDPTNGKLTRITDPDGGTVAVSFDGPLWTGTSWEGAVTGSVSADYDENLWPSSLTVTSGAQSDTVEFAHDEDGLLVQAGAMTFGRSADTGFVADAILGDTIVNYRKNAFGELVLLDASAGSSLILTQGIQRDPLGRVAHISESTGTTTRSIAFTYDDRGRLLRETRDGLATDYTYDANGNRLSVSSPQETLSAEYDAQDRIVRYGNLEFDQSAPGDLVRKTDGARALELSYDEIGNLLRAIVDRGTGPRTIEYVVDGLGRRIAKKVGGVVVRSWLYQDDLRPAAELDQNGVMSRFVYANGSAPEYMVRGGKMFRYVKDHLGSVRFVVEVGTEAIVQLFEYDAFGRITRSDGIPGFQPFGFAGGLLDEDTELVRFGARDYDPEIGRWTAKDPIGFAAGDTNVYAYCGNDPVNLVDRSGLDADIPEWLDALDRSGALQAAGDFSAGLASSLTFTLSDYLIDATGLGKYGSKTSVAYRTGEVAGFAMALYGFASGLGKLAVANGVYTYQAANGAKLFRVLTVRGNPARPSIEFLKIRNVVRLEAHPIRRSWPSWAMYPHMHIDAIDALSHIHIPLIEPLVGGYIIWKF